MLLQRWVCHRCLGASRNDPPVQNKSLGSGSKLLLLCASHLYSCALFSPSLRESSVKTCSLQTCTLIERWISGFSLTCKPQYWLYKLLLPAVTVLSLCCVCLGRDRVSPLILEPGRYWKSFHCLQVCIFIVVCPYFFCLLTQGYCTSLCRPRFGDKDKINTFGARIESTKTVCHHTGTGLHGYGKLGCSWKVCLPQTLLCAVITALRVCCPAVSTGTAAEKVHISKHPAAETELWILKKWQPRWNSRNCHSAAEIKLWPHLCTYIFFPVFQMSHADIVVLVSAARWFLPVMWMGMMTCITCTGWEPKALTPATLVLTSCATGCVLESESHQTANRVRPSHLI